LETAASLVPNSEFNKLDFPTFDRPAKATCGRGSLGPS
jgi:hypothetical protein